MQQILVIHGGTSFNSYDSYIEALTSSSITYDRLKKVDMWREWLPAALPQADVLLPSFPNKQNAQYDEWCIYFEKLLPFLTGTVSLVGYSLGAMFLTKYLHESPLKNPVKQLVLIAPAYNDDSNEELGSFGVTSAVGLEESAHEIHLFHSKDDPVVPFSELSKFQNDLPGAMIHTFSDRNHFFQPTFPELAGVLTQANLEAAE